MIVSGDAQVRRRRRREEVAAVEERKSNSEEAWGASPREGSTPSRFLLLLLRTEVPRDASRPSVAAAGKTDAPRTGSAGPPEHCSRPWGWMPVDGAAGQEIAAVGGPVLSAVAVAVAGVDSVLVW